MVARARRHVQDIPPCPHGSLSSREREGRGLARREVTDFSASCNPLGAAPSVREALARVDLSHYPDDEALELRRALSRRLGFGPDWIAVGNGSVDLMWQLATAYLDPGAPALVAGPTFGEYARACRVAGARVAEVRAREEDGFRPDPVALRQVLRGLRPRLAFLCNPNNPTGQILGTSEIEGLLEECEETLLVVDEAYLPFCRRGPDLRPLLSSDRLLLLRSMTKDHGLAGLRLGYALAQPEVIGGLARVRPPWSVNAAAQAAGLAALEEESHVEAARRVVAEAKSYLVAELSRLGLAVVPSEANFLLVRVGDGAAFRSELLDRGVCVRDCASFGLPAHVRIGVRALPECERLVAALREVLAGA